MTTRDLAQVFDVTSGTASRWKDAGERERQRRKAGDPEQLDTHPG
jgi:transposase